MIILATITGAVVIVNISISARLAQHTSTLKSTFINYIMGLAGILVLSFFLGFPRLGLTKDLPFWAYLGGLIGVSVILLSNYALPRIKAFEMTILVFVGQMATGYFLDALTGLYPSPRQILGALIVALGLSLYSGKLVNKKKQLAGQ